MECSQAVLMLMLLVPCEQSGGKSPEAVVAEGSRTPPVVHAERVPDRVQPAQGALPSGAADAVSTIDAESATEPVPE